MIVDSHRRWHVMVALPMLVLAAQYLPPESARLGPDDYKFLWRFHARDRPRTPPVYFAVSRPVIQNDRLVFTAGRFTGSREFQRMPESVPREGTVIMDFTMVFGDSFQSGLRAR